MNNSITRTQYETLNVIAVFIEDNRYCPTNAELAAIFHITVNALRCRLKQLQYKRLIDWKDMQSRTIHLTDAGEHTLDTFKLTRNSKGKLQ